MRSIYVLFLMLISRDILCGYADVDMGFLAQWVRMQYEYDSLTHALKKNNALQNKQLYVHSNWFDFEKKIIRFITGKPNNNFFSDPIISGTMLRKDKTWVQEYEASYLDNCLSPRVAQLLEKYKDTTVGGLIQQGTLSITTLNHLFYVARVLDACANNQIKTVVEVGGGFGNVARIFKSLFTDLTIVSFDLPAVLALQMLFLRSSLPGVRVVLHQEYGQEIVQGAINLVPMYYAAAVNINADIFISTFALSETTDFFQDIIFNKKFFGADVGYLVGQFDCWDNYVHHQRIFSAARAMYNQVICHPAAGFYPVAYAYELIALNKN